MGTYPRRQLRYTPLPLSRSLNDEGVAHPTQEMSWCKNVSSCGCARRFVSVAVIGDEGLRTSRQTQRSGHAKNAQNACPYGDAGIRLSACQESIGSEMILKEAEIGFAWGAQSGEAEAVWDQGG
ncbi:hypothetical protein B0H13DRAFT_1916998 [Mycena leptocephala]|nr:hypothetical protein B0H13DRAFT_1916998 [Mycena leptocephala]